MSTKDKFTRRDFAVGDKVKAVFDSQFAGHAEEVGTVTDTDGNMWISVTSPYVLDGKVKAFWARTGLPVEERDDIWLEDASPEFIAEEEYQSLRADVEKWVKGLGKDDIIRLAEIKTFWNPTPLDEAIRKGRKACSEAMDKMTYEERRELNRKARERIKKKK